jgi:hypothetical protein
MFTCRSPISFQLGETLCTGTGQATLSFIAFIELIQQVYYTSPTENVKNNPIV